MNIKETNLRYGGIEFLLEIGFESIIPSMVKIS